MQDYSYLKCDYHTSKGRLYQESTSSDFRTPFQRDRDRIIHTTSFRRLKHKTQVFVSYEGDLYRTRLTHSLEVAQVARSIAGYFNIDKDLTEALALAHDLGHPPFGHAGEHALHRKMANFGGFDHNAQTIKILTKLEDKYAEFPGLNLSWESIEGIAKHNGPLIGDNGVKWKDLHHYFIEYNKLHNLELDKFSSFEAQVAAVSDDIAYNAHDIEDGLRAGLLNFDEIIELSLVKNAYKSVTKRYPDIKRQEIIFAETIRAVLKNMIYDVIANTENNIKNFKYETSNDIRNASSLLVNFSPELLNQINELRAFLKAKLYRHFKVNRMTKKAETIVENLFDYFMESPNCLPNYWLGFINSSSEESKASVICDYIAGMTDNFALKEHSLLFNLEKQNL